MPAKVLTDAAIRKYTPQRSRREIPDARAEGLYLIVEPSGTKTWAMRFRKLGGEQGQKSKLRLGPVDFSGQEITGDPVIGQPLTLRSARALAAAIHRQRALGIDVVAESKANKRRRRAAKEQTSGDSFGVLARTFIEEHAKPNVRRWRNVAGLLGLVYPLDGGEPVVTEGGLMQRWGDKPVTAIDAHLIYETIDEARRHGVPGRERRNKGISDARGRDLARALSRFFSWLVEHRKITANPCLGGYVPPPPKDRERVLSPDEVRWFWAGCDALGYPFGPLFMLLLICGCRREEARAARYSEIADDGTWVIPGARTKNRRSHTVLLPPLARNLLANLPRIENEADFVFCTNGKTPVSGFSKLKRKLDAAMLEAARAEAKAAGRNPSKVTLEPFVIHDLRRTCASGLQRLGIPTEVIEKCLGHVSGTFAGVVGVYQRDALIEQRRVALERWAAHIAGLTSRAPSNVVSMRLPVTVQP